MTASAIPILAALLAPGFLIAGLGLISIPILIHILNRRRFKTVQWAAMEFLLRAMKKNRRRLKFEQWILLAVRCCVLALLGLALARPTGCDNRTAAVLGAQKSGLHVFVIDNSLSMAYDAGRQDAPNHLARAKQLAKGLIERLSSGGESVAIISAATPPTVVLPPTFSLDVALGATERLPQTQASSDLPGALGLALDLGRKETTQSTRRLHILTDATRSAFEAQHAQPLREAAPQLAQVFKPIAHYNLGLREQDNAAVAELRASGNLVTTRFGTDFIAAVRGFGTVAEANVQWKLDDNLLPAGRTVRPEAGGTDVTLANPPLKRGGPHVLSVTLAGDDRLKADNVRHRVIDVASELKVLIVEGERAPGPLGGSGAFLSLALAPPSEGETSGQRSSSHIAPELISDLELGNRLLDEYRAVILCGVGQVQPAIADNLARFVQSGGALILFMGEAVTGDNYNDVLLPRKLMPGPLTKRVSASADERGFVLDFKPDVVQHPLLSIFYREPRSGLDTAQVETYWQTMPEQQVERVLNYLPNAAGSPGTPDPAITAHSLGAGRVIFVSTTANAEWTSLPAKPAYVTLMHELVAGSVSTSDRWMNLTVGQPLVLPVSLRLTSQPTLTDPSGKPVLLSIPDGGAERTYRSSPLDRAGVYQLSTGRSTIPIAVNVPPDEADVRTIDNAAVKKALGDVEMELWEAELPADATVDATTGADFGWPVLLLVLLLVGGESLMAMRFGHYKRA